MSLSEILAFLQVEPSEEMVRLALQSTRCVLAAANHSEVISKVPNHGVDADAIKTMTGQLFHTVIDSTS
jgi:hypothetical protein